MQWRTCTPKHNSSGICKTHDSRTERGRSSITEGCREMPENQLEAWLLFKQDAFARAASSLIKKTHITAHWVRPTAQLQQYNCSFFLLLLCKWKRQSLTVVCNSLSLHSSSTYSWHTETAWGKSLPWLLQPLLTTPNPSVHLLWASHGIRFQKLHPHCGMWFSERTHPTPVSTSGSSPASAWQEKEIGWKATVN